MRCKGELRLLRWAAWRKATSSVNEALWHRQSHTPAAEKFAWFMGPFFLQFSYAVAFSPAVFLYFTPLRYHVPQKSVLIFFFWGCANHTPCFIYFTFSKTMNLFFLVARNMSFPSKIMLLFRSILILPDLVENPKRLLAVCIHPAPLLSPPYF